MNIPVHSIVNTKDNKFNFIDISSHLPFLMRKIRKTRTLDYFTWSSIDVTEFGDFDLILSSGSTTRALITPENVPFINIAFSTPRWLYDLYHWRRKRMRFGKQLVIPFAECMRILDCSVDHRVDYQISISEVIQKRIWKFMKRQSDVIHPPIDVSKYQNKSSEGYFLFISRLEPEKRPLEAIEACINTHQKLMVVGTGSLQKRLESKYKHNRNIIFMGFVSDELKIELLSHCESLIYIPIAEDYGLVPLEALSSGKAVLCADTGFPPLLIGNKYGIATDGSIDGIKKGLKEINKIEFNPDDLRRYAMRFDYSIFKERINERMKFYKKDFDERFK